MQTAVLFLIFNRPDTTRRVVSAIRDARPPRLYVAADGPRRGHAGDDIDVEIARKIATDVEWDCEVRTLFREVHLGCRRAVSGALDWFFTHEQSGVILEDDCLPHPSFFSYAEQLLERYCDDERIMCISAQHFHGDLYRGPYSYFFSRYNHCWGWASWRRAWEKYDHDMQLWPDLRSTDWLLSVGDGSRLFERYWTDIFDVAYEDKKIDSWAYRWTFSCWTQNGIAILPSGNLVSNIGFGKNASHTNRDNAVLANLTLESMEFPLVHPRAVVRNVAADRWTDRYVFDISVGKDIRRKVRKSPVGVYIDRLLSQIRQSTQSF